jgi:hypothetical protein
METLILRAKSRLELHAMRPSIGILHSEGAIEQSYSGLSTDINLYIFRNGAIETLAEHISLSIPLTMK